jgi:hypothetical protein
MVTLSPITEKVFKKLKFTISHNDITGIITATPGVIEKVLFSIFNKIKKIEQEREAADTSLDDRNGANNTEARVAYQLSAQLVEKEETIHELRSTIEILETKMRRMEELNRLKDAKIESLIRKL